MEISRRGLLIGASSLLICSPAIVRASSLDLVKGELLDPYVLAYNLLTRAGYAESAVEKPLWKKVLELSQIPGWQCNSYAMKRRSELIFLGDYYPLLSIKSQASRQQ